MIHRKPITLITIGALLEQVKEETKGKLAKPGSSGKQQLKWLW